MRIAQIASINVSVPPERYGGTELIISLLTEELVRRGHEVTLYATGDSKTSAKLSSYYPKAMGFGKDTPEKHLKASEFAFKDADQFDLIHNHVGTFGLKYAKTSKTPVLTTLHNDYLLPQKSSAFEEFKNTGSFVAISHDQKKRSKGLNIAGVVYNAIEAEKYPLKEEKDGFLLFFGNLIKEKGIDVAVKTAQELKMKLIISGKADPGPQKDFFDREIKPHIDNKNIVLLPPVDQKTKIDLLSRAKCLLFPIAWNEPFGLAMIEAMACGTPVVAYNRGSVPEIVKDGVTGYVADNYEELLEAVAKLDKISPQTCRQHVEDNFNVKKMVDGYEALYKTWAV